MKVVCFGDSLTQGYMVSKGYVDFLKDYFSSHTFINSGVPGDTSFDGLRRLQSSVLYHSPDITIVEFGVNDAFCGISVGEFERNMRFILSQIRGVKILMVPHTLFHKLDRKIVKPFYERIKTIALSENLPFIDVSIHTLKKEELLSDLLHPNEKGYKIYSKEARKILINYLVKK